MRVERLEIFGFKSFMERLVLPLEAGITGVVGPNGCGKSNVVDALRWVLGETRASQLRGDLLEDVIFNGTESLRPLGLAEVTVVIRAERDSFYQDLISYYEQIEVGSVSLATPPAVDEAQADNSDLIDGHQGSSDFVSDIKASLSKYAWMQSVSEVQVTRRLYRSGESEFFINKVPCRLRDLKDFFRVVGLAARGYTIIAQGEIGRIISAKPDDRRAVIEEAAHIAGFRDHMNAVGKRLTDTQAQLVRMDDVIKEVTRQVAHLKRQAARALNRAQLKEELALSERELFTDTIARLSARAEEVKQRISELVEQEQRSQKELEDLRASEEHSREQSVRFDAEIDMLRGQADLHRDELQKRGREVSVAEARLRELTAFTQARKAEIQRLHERRAMLSQRSAESRQSVETLEVQDRDLEESLRCVDLSGEEELKQISSELVVLRDDHRARDRAIREMRDQLVSAQSRRDALQAQMAAASPLAHLKRALGGEHKMPPEVTGDYKLLVDGIRVPDRYSKALQAVLAERASFLVVDDVSAVARTFQELVLRADPSNKRGLGLGLFASTVSGDDRDSVAMQLVDGVDPLLRHVETTEWSRSLVSKLLASVFVARDLHTAMMFLEANNLGTDCVHDSVVVTESGDLLSSWSFYSLRHEGGMIQMKSKIDEASRIIEDNQGRYDLAVSERDELIVRIAGHEKRHAELVRLIQQGQANLRQISNRQAEVRGRLQSERKLLQQLDGDLERIEPQALELDQQLAHLESAKSQVTENISVLRQQDNSELEQALTASFNALRDLELKRKGLRDASAGLSRTVEQKRQAFEASRERVVRERMASERLRGEIEGMEAHVRERLGEEALGALKQAAVTVSRLEEGVRRDLEGRVLEIRQRLEREGEVDPTVVEQHEVESRRLDDLNTQRDDLSRAAESLQIGLAEVSEACTRRFVSTFDAISRNFSYFAPKLFGGGSAELTMIDPSMPLESGVEVFVRPPGKKPKSIDLLSGGEKALCAIAFVFSMFMVRPSPLCVLDEVDAPLDEANVQRFISFIKEMSGRTQFLMITHNKQSMAAADTLVGVTMPTPGASKVLTVSLQEAVKQVA